MQSVSGMLVLHGFVVEFLLWDQLDPERQAIRVHDEQMARRIERGASPIHSADITGKGNRPLQGWRGKDSFGARCRDPLAAPLAIRRRFSPCVSDSALLGDDRIDGGERLGWRAF